MKEPIFTWDAETKKTTCTIIFDNKQFCGCAYCHPDDDDMASEKTGSEIALRRAMIKAYKYQKLCLKEQLSALKQLYYSMSRSKKFNENSYENKMLQSQISLISFDLATVKETIAMEEQSVKAYIANKEDFYQRIRRNRRKDNLNK